MTTMKSSKIYPWNDEAEELLFRVYNSNTNKIVK